MSLSSKKKVYEETHPAPTTVEEANAWLQRVGYEKYKFIDIKDDIIYINNNSKQVILFGDTVEEMAIIMVTNKAFVEREDMPPCDWKLRDPYRGAAIFSKPDVYYSEEDNYPYFKL